MIQRNSTSRYQRINRALLVLALVCSVLSAFMAHRTRELVAACHASLVGAECGRMLDEGLFSRW